MSLISKGYQILRNEGILQLSKRGWQYVSNNIHDYISLQFAYIKGHYTASVANTNVKFSAPSRSVIQMNNGRLWSEQDVIADLLQESTEQDIFYDIGANTGLYALFAAKECGEVVAFEPYLPNARLLNTLFGRLAEPRALAPLAGQKRTCLVSALPLARG